MVVVCTLVHIKVILFFQQALTHFSVVNVLYVHQFFVVLVVFWSCSEISENSVLVVNPLHTQQTKLTCCGCQRGCMVMHTTAEPHHK